ncbi:DUF3265 domain-containing protein [Vibrio parahaemolyticus]|nr:DUF3265 domain-containing protein [Vibrio parahaemolyticus]EHZ2575507.1 DUF3265 domain-containing protein [Vibrio parahaemolyticus]ELA7420903.1 DUF3265 domain-containing protein [Vibrio parahaemolyticus]ELB2780025.1 DUF3265 domain-containing protein [Vibrio parahaemolyticus]RPB30858.1 DUF3265 domain-containing protein [Vibrio parahaemolyticus]
MTRRLSGIHAAWHFWFAVSFGGESGLRQLGLCGIHPLTRRYVFGGNHGKTLQAKIKRFCDSQ